jgi:hypothetical protein
MEKKYRNKWPYLYLLGLLVAFQPLKAVDKKAETHCLLMQVNKNWAGLENAIQHTYQPHSEQELVQLHLLNVVSYLEKQELGRLNEVQKSNRAMHIAVLKRYALRGEFPLNHSYDYRTPIFIDAHGVHCAVGYLLKENGLGKVARDIADHQLLSYLGDIKHPELGAWQKSSGLSYFELALIQPTYGPPTPICSKESPIQWKTISARGKGIQKLYSHNNSMYGIAQINEYGLKNQVQKLTSHTQQWSAIGTVVDGEILDLVFCNNQVYISAILPKEDFPYQLLRLQRNQWIKVAHFNGHIKDVQALNNKLYVHGKFTKVNDSIKSNFVTIDNNTILPFRPYGLRTSSFDQIVSSQTALFLTSNGGIYKLKKDTLRYLASIQYYQYIKQVSLDASYDSMFISSINIPGYYTHHDRNTKSTSINNRLSGQSYPYGTAHFTKSKKVNGRMMISGDFRTSTLMPQINENRVLVKCHDSLSYHWFGEGLMYEYGQMFYPILNQGIVLDFVQVGDLIYILKKDGSMQCAYLSQIQQKINQFQKGIF